MDFDYCFKDTKIWTYPLAYRETLSKYYGYSPHRNWLWTSPKLRKYLKTRINIIRQFDVEGKDILDVGSNLGSYLHFINCKTADAVESDKGVVLAAREITKVVNYRCSRVEFHTEIPSRHYHYAFILGPLYTKKGKLTSSDYKELFGNTNIDTFVFWDRGNRFDEILEKVDPTVMHVTNDKVDKLLIITKDQLTAM